MTAQAGITAAFQAFGSDPAAARRMFRELGADGDPRAQAAYALMLARGKGGGTDPSSAVAWYAKAATQGHAVACYALASLVAEGKGTAKDPALALQWYVRAAELGDRDALLALGLMYARGEGASPDPVAALSWWRRAAVRGHPVALLHLGHAYAQGEGVPVDLATAGEWYLEAATKGEEEATTALARILPQVMALAETVPAAAFVASSFAAHQDPVEGPRESLRLLERAAAGGHGRACHRLASKVRKGDAPGGDERVMALLEQGAAAGSPEAQHELADAYGQGHGVAQDLGTAVHWYRMAARTGRASSLTALGATLLAIATTEPEQREGQQALHESALAGDPKGMFLYGIQCADADPIESLRWLLEAADTGHDEALHAARSLADARPVEELVQADRRTGTDGAVAMILREERPAG